MCKQYSTLYDKALVKSRKKEEDTMCDTLKRLKGVSAEEILRIAGQENCIPVDMDKVIEAIKLHKQARDFSDIENIEKKGKISGLVVIIENDIKILYNKNDSLEEKRFTAAHEIGHCCLHGDSLKNYYIEFLHKNRFQNRHEREASAFASRLLIPTESLLSVYKKLIKPTLEDLSEIFQVPQKLMKKRLKEEKLKV